VDTDETLQNALSTGVVFYGMDAEKGEGIELARKYNVGSFPTFILVNAEGQTLDQWLGYGSVDGTIGTLTAALEDPTTVRQKMARFRETPTAKDAGKLASIRQYTGHYGDAVAFYLRAVELDTEGTENWAFSIFDAMADGKMRSGMYTTSQVAAQGELVMASELSSGNDQLTVAGYMVQMAKDDPETFTPFLSQAIEATEGDEELAAGRARLMPDYALHVLNDPDKAVEYKKATLPEGWMENSGALNSFAWWCFENEVNLDEAEQLARTGVELAASGREKGNILDTLAEICNVTGNCGEAVELMRQAVAEDPDNEYFQKQLARFEELLAQQDPKG